MKRISVDIGGTFTDCFVAWGNRFVQSKALTTHHNLALGFDEALEIACGDLSVSKKTLLSEVDSVRYATTLGTNALIERKGPRIGLLITAGFKSIIPIARACGYGVGLDAVKQADVPNAGRPEPLVPIPMIREVRERVDHAGNILMDLDEKHLRAQLRELVDMGAEALVVVLTNSVVNSEHELRIREIFLEEYPSHLLGAIPILLSHQVAGRKGEYVRAMSTIMDAFLHQVMYHGLGTLELNLRNWGYLKPMLVNHNSGGMAQLNSTNALQTVHSGPISGIAASEHLALQGGLGNCIATDMGGTSFDIGIVVEGGVKHYDFSPVIERWMVSLPMVHLVTLGAGGGSIAKYDRMYQTVRIGPESSGSDPGPACYDRGGMLPTVTDADLLLGYLDPGNYAGGRACGAGNVNQLHIHEASTYLVLFDANGKTLFRNYERFNTMVEELEQRGYDDLIRQGMKPEDIHYRLELDMRYGNQRVQTAVVSEMTRLRNQHDVLSLMDMFHRRYGERFGQGSQAPEAGVRINTIRVCAYVEQSKVAFSGIKPTGRALAIDPVEHRPCHFVGQTQAMETQIYDERALVCGVALTGPAIVVTSATSYLIEPGWRYEVAEQNAVWFTRLD
ncbi:MAG: hydantoinase/oxoprolinase family protein [Proteobacteria bacterium]|nr:hydantoinase/oxoprolinase family protein [Pseudomonadota bacterium]